MSDFVFVADHRNASRCCMCGKAKRAHVLVQRVLACPDAFEPVQRGKAAPRHRAPSRSERASLARRARLSGALLGLSLATVGVKPVSATQPRRTTIGRNK